MVILEPRVTRLAPSPTGALHLGNARTFLINWLMARQSGWQVALRIEDLDAARAKPGTDRLAMDDLRWLGMDWDTGPTYQLDHLNIYADATRKLLDSGAAYPCVCTRIEAALAGSAPHAEDGGAVYPGTCFGKFASIEEARTRTGREPCVRLRVPPEPIDWNDRFHGAVRYENPQTMLGDFVISRAGGLAAYQLAVVIDDAAAKVNEVVRGDDLLDSAARQMLVYRALGLVDQTPTYTHLPLLVGEDGKRLAKRHGDTRVAQFRQSGIAAGRVRAFLARQVGVAAGDTIDIHELIERFQLSRVPRAAITINHRDLAELV